MSREQLAFAEWSTKNVLFHKHFRTLHQDLIGAIRVHLHRLSVQSGKNVRNQFQTLCYETLSPLSYLFDLINYASLILSNKLSILFHPIIVWPCGQYYKVQGWAHV